MKHPITRRAFALSSIALTALSLLSFGAVMAAEQPIPKPATTGARTDLAKVSIEKGREGIHVVRSVNKMPDAQGFVLSEELVLPHFTHGCYYRPFSGGGHRSANGNRVSALAFTSLDDLAEHKPSSEIRRDQDNRDLGQFMLLKLDDGSYMALMPLVTKNVMSAFFITDRKLIIKTGHFGTEQVSGDIPTFAHASGKTPYEASHSVWALTLKSGIINTDWRMNKSYPEMYAYLGWCSWEQYRTDINEENMIQAVKTIESCGTPIRWFMVDDGYLTQEGKRLINFTPDSKKFPNGWEPITGLKNPDKIRWMGLWRNMLGYMQGISKEQDMDLPEGTLIPNAHNACLVPNGSEEAARAFYHEMVQKTKAGGFDFVKVDFQARALSMYYGMENPIRAMHNNNLSLEEMSKKHLGGLLNCIAQTHVNVFNTKYSALTRSSRDYYKSTFNKDITYQSFANHLWLGQVVWGDLDMFDSSGADAYPLAIARAISGGPVYVSDEPSKISREITAPFCSGDGKLFRASAPATLLPESFFIDPFGGQKAFRVIAPVEGQVAALALFNFTEGRKVQASISPADYPFAGEQLQPYKGGWVIPEEGLLAYDQASGTVCDLDKELTFPMKEDSAKLYLIYPKQAGWVVIGRTDKYLPAAAVKITSCTPKQVIFTLSESGPFAVWSASGVPEMQGVTFEAKGHGLYSAKMHVGANVTCVVTR